MAIKSDFLEIISGVPQGSILGPVLISVFINDVGKGIQAKYHLYADNSFIHVIHTCAPSLVQALQELQIAFNSLQNALSGFKLILNAQKAKFMFFSKVCSQMLDDTSIFMSDCKSIESVSSYKYLGIWINDKLSFKLYVANLVRKLKIKIAFYFKNKSCFTLNARKKLVEATFLPVIDYGDILYTHPATSTLQSLDPVYHASLCFIADVKSLTHHCTL